ncbi:MAG: serine/threonine protein kinase, partial [Deltaproteobacteria bacterium]|nr:serine/threonine protein kinase [Deltaproteobacteria bacterium]
RLPHPSVVQVYDADEDPIIGPFIVFEYVQGQSLRSVLRAKGKLTVEEAMAVAWAIGEALDAAHDAGILHRDVKPENILIDASGRAKLADFGIARVVDVSLTQEGQFLGTPRYSAPEAFFGKYSRQSDLFSLAIVVYEMLTGQLPFGGDTPLAAMYSILHSDPVPLSVLAPELPSALDEVFSKAFAKDASLRFGRASEFLEALERAFAAEVRARQEQFHSAKRWLAAGFSVFLIAMAGGATAFVFFAQGQRNESRVPQATPPPASSHEGTPPLSQAAQVEVLVPAPPLTESRSSFTSTAIDQREGSVARILPSNEALLSDSHASARINPESVQLTDEGSGEAGGPVPFEEANESASASSLMESTSPPTSREEQAKEFIDAARRALQERDWLQARLYLRIARALDPENVDIEAIERAIGALGGE